MNEAATPSLHPLLEQMTLQHGFTRVTADTIDDFIAAPGHVLLAFTEDPQRYKETLDLAVIAPQIARTFVGRLRPAVLMPADARRVAPRYGFARWPALVVLRDGRYVGAIDGLRNWQDYVDEVERLLTAEPTRAPIGIAATNAAGSGCH
jgi:hydrogenase-1 operon protein HyaE